MPILSISMMTKGLTRLVYPPPQFFIREIICHVIVKNYDPFVHFNLKGKTGRGRVMLTTERLSKVMLIIWQTIVILIDDNKRGDNWLTLVRRWRIKRSPLLCPSSIAWTHWLLRLFLSFDLFAFSPLLYNIQLRKVPQLFVCLWICFYLLSRSQITWTEIRYSAKLAMR